MQGTHFKHDHVFYGVLFFSGLALALSVTALSIFTRTAPVAQSPIAHTPEITAQANQGAQQTPQTQVYIVPSEKVRTSVTIIE